MISFTVDGQPATKGSFRPVRTREGKTRLLPQLKRTKPWQDAIGWSARAAMRSAPPMTGAVTIEAVFRFERPKSTKLATPRLDVDKLLRALLDGMTGIVYVDDKQVAQIHARKEWGPPGVSVTAGEVLAGSVGILTGARFTFDERRAIADAFDRRLDHTERGVAIRQRVIEKVVALANLDGRP